MLQETDATQFLFCNQLCVRAFSGRKDGVGQESCLQQIAYDLRSFCHEEVLAPAVLLQLQRANELDLVFANHVFCIICVQIYKKFRTFALK